MKRHLIRLSLLAILAAVAVAVPSRRAAADPETRLIDTVAEVVEPTSFVLANSRILVSTDPATQFPGFGGVGDLAPGDLVQVEGSFVGEVLVASVVEVLQPAPPVNRIVGQIAYLDPADLAFVLADGTRAEVHPATVYVGVAGYPDLAAGDTVAVDGVSDLWSSTIQVDRLERIATAPQATYASLYGWVESVTLPDRVELDSGTGTVTVQVSDSTALVNFAALADLAVGDLLWVEASTTDQLTVFAAVSLYREHLPGWPVSRQLTVAEVDATGSFTTVEGYLVRVDSDTRLLGLAGLGGLQAGDQVRVEGLEGPDPTVILATLVELVGSSYQGWGGLSSSLQGTVTLLVGPMSFVLDSSWLVTTDASTLWLGALTGYADLEVGMVVSVAATWNPDGRLLAGSVEGLSLPEAGIVTLTGTVVEVDLADTRLSLASGEQLLVEPGTPVDGDVDSFVQIAVGMSVSAECVPISGVEYRALAVYVLQAETTFSSPVPVAEALVMLVEGADPEEVAGRNHATIAGRLPGTLVHLFTWDPPASPDQVQELLDDPEVSDVELNNLFEDPESSRRRTPVFDRHPTSAKYNQQEAVAATGLVSAYARTTGAGTLVAVVDTGVDPFHPFLRHRIAAGGLDFVDGDSEPWETTDGVDQDGDGEVDEAAGHGTFVAGLVLLAAPSTSILPYRVLDNEGNGTTFAICQAVLAAMDRGADVINLSLTYHERSRILDRIMDEATRRGVVLVCGAGNDAVSDLPFPARDRQVIAVAAVDGEDALAEFSNFGASVALAAPGVELYSGLDAQRFGTWSGTSMAAPLVSGAVALLRSVNPHLTPDQVRAALVQGLRPLTGDPHGVPGVLQVDAALALVPSAR